MSYWVKYPFLRVCAITGISRVCCLLLHWAGAITRVCVVVCLLDRKRRKNVFFGLIFAKVPASREAVSGIHHLGGSAVMDRGACCLCGMSVVCVGCVCLCV